MQVKRVYGGWSMPREEFIREMEDGYWGHPVSERGIDFQGKSRELPCPRCKKVLILMMPLHP